MVRALEIDYDLCVATGESVDMDFGEDGKLAPLDWKTNPVSTLMFKCIASVAVAAMLVRPSPEPAFYLI